MLEKTDRNLLDCETKPVNPKGNQSWIFIGRTIAEREAPILWPPDEKNRLIGKDPDAGKDWRQEEKGMMEDEMVGWHQWVVRHDVEALGVGGGQGSLVWCSPWGHNKSDTTERLNWTCQCRRHKRCRFSPWVGKVLWRRAWQPTPVSCLENSMDRGAWWATVHCVTESDMTEAT